MCNRLNGVLNSDLNTVGDRAVALTALQRLISMLKQNVDQFVPNVMATLQKVRILLVCAWVASSHI